MIVLLITLFGLICLIAMFVAANLPVGIYLAIGLYFVVMFLWAGTHNVSRTKKGD